MIGLLWLISLLTVATEAQPVSLAIVVQGNPETLRHADETQAALQNLLSRARPGDEFFSVLALDEPKLLADFTASPAGIGAGLAQVGKPRHNHLYDAMEFALRHLESAHNARRAVLVIASGEDVASRWKPAELVARMERGPVPLFVVSLIARYRDDLAPTWFELTRLARRSGGDWWEPGSFGKLDDTLKQVDFHRPSPARLSKP